MIVPVERYRSGEEMNAAPARIVVDGDAFERFIRHCARFRKLNQGERPRGVFKFRTIEEAQAARNSPATGR